MGFLRAEIDYRDKKYVAIMYYSWMYIGETTVEKIFTHLRDAKDWVLHERCYNQFKITDEAHNALSYSDALRLQLRSKQYTK